MAVALPALVLVLVVGIAGLSTAARHVRLQDAVADAARLAARGESADRVSAAIALAAPGASSRVEDRGDVVCVIATAPGALMPTVTATGCALAGGR